MGGSIFSDDIVVNRPPLLPKAIAKAPPGEGCPRCGGYVYAAEQMLARGRVSGKKRKNEVVSL